MASSLTNPIPDPNSNPTAHRPVAGFAPCPWGNRFLNYTPDTKVIEAQQEIAKVLKEEIRRELVSVGDKSLIEQLRLIDSIERLGVAYHFEEEIQDVLRRVHEMSADTSSDDLLLTSLHFCLLRLHCFKVSSDVFKKFLGSNGTLKEEVASDVQGMLSLYEACHVRVLGEDILDEALPLTVSQLKSILVQSSDSSLDESIRQTLQLPIRKRVIRLECARYIKVYEEDPFHNKTLLKFAKVDFNLLQASHKEELSEICRWWKHIDLAGKLPLRDRIVENFAWSTAVYFEPKYSLARKVATMGCHIVTSVDDIYDAYATLEELEIFTEAIQRWDESCLDQLPLYLRWFYQTLILDAHDKMERLLAPVGRSRYVHYVKKEMKALARSYLTEAKWRNKNYIPKLDEYMANDWHRNTAYVAAAAYCILGMDTATDQVFEWLSSLPKPIKTLCHILRIFNDIGGKKFDENRGLSSLFLECYMKEHSLSYEQASEELYKKANELWTEMNEGMIPPIELPMPVINCIDNMSRAIESIYGGGEDSLTMVNRSMKQNINTLYIDSIPM